MKNPILLAKDLIGKGKKYWKTPPTGKFLTLKEILFFGGGGLGINFISSVIGTVITASQIPEFYGIAVYHGVIIFIIASSAGIFAQLGFGKILQNAKHTKLGKYKPFILFLAPLVGVLAVIASWLPQNLNSTTKIIFAYTTSVPTLVMLNLLLNTFNMMPGIISPNQQERSNVWAPVNIILNLAPTLFGLLKGYVRAYYLGKGQEYMAFRVMGIVGVILGFAATTMLIKVQERVYEVSTNKEHVKLIDGLKQVVKNRPLMILTLALILGSLRVCIETSSELVGRLRYGTTFEEGLKTFSSLTLITGFAATPNMILLPLLTKKFNNKTIMIGWQILNTCAYIILLIVGYGNIPVGTTSALVITGLRFMALFNAVGSLLPLMLAEIYDYQQWKTGKRLEGFIQTFAYAIVLLATQFAMLIPALIQTNMGFTPNDYFDKEINQLREGKIAVALEYFDIALLLSIISGVLFIIVMLFYNLDKKKYAVVVAELKAKNVNTEISDQAENEAGLEELKSSETIDINEVDAYEQNNEKDKISEAEDVN
ncbi:MAG: MFS transporter [Christensenellaceae bacterium]|nr:MFS transporter [Christensenellaceae bacterium]